MEFVNFPVPLDRFADVCALLGGAAPAAVVSTTVPTPKPAPVIDEPAPAPQSEDAAEIEVDAEGIPFDPEIHTGTKKKDGTWRIKKGMSDKAAELEPIETPSETSTASPATETVATATEPAGSSPTEEPASADASQDEDDEFAAFRAAAAKADAEEVEAKASVPARKWTDADLGKLCNQAAVKLGDPSPIKELIAKFVPEGEVAHSRNIPTDRREEFAAAVEEKAGIEFAG